MEERIKELLFNVKTADILVVLNARNTVYPKKLSAHTDTTYSHTVRLLSDLEERGLVTSRKHGRKKQYQLTGRGKEVASELSRFYDVTGLEAEDHQKEKPDFEKDEGVSRPKLSDTLASKGVTTTGG